MQKRHIKVVTRLAIVLALPLMGLLSQPAGSASQPGAGLEASGTAHHRTQVPMMTVSFMTAIQAGFR